MAGDDEMQSAFESEEIIQPMDGGSSSQPPSGAPSESPPRKSASAASSSGHRRKRVSGGGGADSGPKKSSILPGNFPVQPLGSTSGRYYFLSARGELTELSAGAISNRQNLVNLLAGSKTPLRHLKDLAPPKSKDIEFNSTIAADKLMRACSELPLYDVSRPIRHFGTWRGATAHPIVHLGEKLEVAPEEEQVGRMVSGALYPAVPSRSGPSEQIVSADELDWIRERIQRGWAWRLPCAGDLVIGWIGQAVLGQYPDWRAHMWIRGQTSCGKSTLLNIISSLLGGMSNGVEETTSAAAVRQLTNRMAYARLFDESERKGDGQIEEVIGLFRLMSGAKGARVAKGTSDHAGIRFELYGAGLLASIIPGVMEPQDQNRFVVLAMGSREPSGTPEDDALRLIELEQDAAKFGPMVWRRMLRLAPQRWDQTYRIYNAMVQGLGGSARVGDTIGSMLAGWDLMLFEAPLLDADNGEKDLVRLERARSIAAPLIEQYQASEDETEAQSCLRHILTSYIHKDHGGLVQVNELILAIQEYKDAKSGEYENKLLARLGLRVMPGDRFQRDLFIANPRNQQLDKALAGTRWRGGSHRDALDTDPDIKPAPGSVRTGGQPPQRGLIVPARFLPGFEEKTDAETEGADG